MKKYKVMTVGAFLFMLCLYVSGSNIAQQETKTETQLTQEQAAASYKVEDLLAKGDSLANKTVTVEGLCSHLCPHGGAKLFLKASDGKQTIRVEAGTVIGSFSKDAIKKQVSITGKLVEQRIDEAFLANWENTLKQPAPKKEVCNSTGCASEGKARGENVASPATQRIAIFRKKIADRKAKEGKNYLSFYYLEADSYKINN